MSPPPKRDELLATFPELAEAERAWKSQEDTREAIYWFEANGLIALD